MTQAKPHPRPHPPTSAISPTLAVILAILLVGLAQFLFLDQIQYPKSPNFDEFHYIPAAKQILAGAKAINTEHPPLAKQLMSLGIDFFGDRPLGWRFMSTIFGSLTLLGMMFWAQVLFHRREVSLWVGAITLLNQLLYVQARIAMLDTFMAAFLIWSMAFFSMAWTQDSRPRQTQARVALSALFLGLACACKWPGWVVWFLGIFLFLIVGLFRKWGVQFQLVKHPIDEAFYSSKLFHGVKVRSLLLIWLVLPWIPYYLSFGFVSPGDFIIAQKLMWQGQLRVVDSHPYMSHWWQWPLLTRPIWYAFEKEDVDFVRGVLLLGNPLIMITGFFASFIAFYAWIEKRSREAFLIASFFFALSLCWMVIPRKISFYYYYYPAGLILSQSLAFIFFEYLSGEIRFSKTVRFLPWGFLLGSLAFFLYFFPILSAEKIPFDTFRNWMWFKSWI